MAPRSEGTDWSHELTAENLRTVRQLAEELPAFTEASLRWHLFHSKANGLERAVVRLGRRVLIDRRAFDAWLEAQRAR